MTQRILGAVAALGLLAGPALAADWTLDGGASAISYVSIKNADTAEPNLLPSLTGGVDETGAAVVEVTLDAVETYIDIRNERMREHLFKTASFPVARLTADLDMSTFEGLGEGETTAHDFDVTVAANDAEATYLASAWVTRVGENRVQVSSREPVILYADDLGYEAGLETLRGIAGLVSFQLPVPVA